MIRNMQIDDIDQVMEIETKVFSHPWRKMDFLYELKENPFSTIWVVEVNQTIVAYLGYWHDENLLQLTTLAVDENYQGNGYAKAMMKHLFDFAHDQKIDAISLEVRESNFKAIGLYEHFNFKKAAIRENYYSQPNEDGILMVCNMKGDLVHENTSH